MILTGKDALLFLLDLHLDPAQANRPILVYRAERKSDNMPCVVFSVGAQLASLTYREVMRIPETAAAFITTMRDVDDADQMREAMAAITALARRAMKQLGHVSEHGPH